MDTVLTAGDAGGLAMPDLTRPDRMTLALDLPGEDFDLVRSGAKELRALLEKLGLNCFIITTASRGLHVVMPLNGSHGFDKVQVFVGDVRKLPAARKPNQFTVQTRKGKRRDRLFIDYSRN
jgi:bifunctional non-homologous end joining protein LigD